MALFHSVVNDTNYRVQQTFDSVIVVAKKAASEDLDSVRVIPN